MTCIGSRESSHGTGRPAPTGRPASDPVIYNHCQTTKHTNINAIFTQHIDYTITIYTIYSMVNADKHTKKNSTLQYIVLYRDIVTIYGIS